jgi:hypothetical protein
MRDVQLLELAQVCRQSLRYTIIIYLMVFLLQSKHSSKSSLNAVQMLKMVSSRSIAIRATFSMEVL